MKQINVFLIALCLLFNISVQAQTIDKYFVDMPAILMPGLPSSLRLELTEYYKSERRDSIRNQFGYSVHLLAFDTVSGYISLQTAPNTRFEMKTLQHTDSSVVLAVIHTVCGPVCSSYIHFYDKRWNEVKTNFPKLSNLDWLKNPEEMVNGEKVENILRTSFIELTINPLDNTVEARNNSVEYLSLEDKKLIEQFMKNNIVRLKWKNGKWER